MQFELHNGDCIEIMRVMADNSVDSIVTDPPYGLSDHSLADTMACLQAWLAGEEYRPKKKGFMGRSWDAWVPGPEVWRECLRVLKPGGHLLAFAGTRSMDLMSMAVRLAGFELRDAIGSASDGGDPTQAPLMAWCYGSGFPKSMDVSKAIDGKLTTGRSDSIALREVNETRPGEAVIRKSSQNGHAGIVGSGDVGPSVKRDTPATDAARQWQGWGTALKPAWEPIILARKPLSEGTVAANVLQHGTGALNVDGCRVGDEVRHAAYTSFAACHGNQLGAPGTAEARRGTQGEAKEYVGRWPANLIHDGSPDVVALFPDSNGAGGSVPTVKVTGYGDGIGTGKSEYLGGERTKVESGSGSAARFFYCAKASRRDRDEGLEGFEDQVADPYAQHRGRRMPEGSKRFDGKPAKTGRNIHPTVKPTDLMAYLVRLVTPPGGVVLDPFLGSGSTGKAAIREGFRFVGCELSPEYLEIARARIEFEADNLCAANDNKEPATGDLFAAM